MTSDSDWSTLAREMRVILDGSRTAREHMATDVRLAMEGRSVMRLFRWDPPACSLGWKQPVPEWLDETRARASGVDVVERPTGGGIAWHGSDLSCAVVMSSHRGTSIHRIMTLICGTAAEVCRSFGVKASIRLHVGGGRRITVCLSEPSSYAVMAGERKLAGFAIRRFAGSWLIQGSLLVRSLPDVLARIMPEAVRLQLTRRAISLSEAAGSPVRESDVARRWESLINPSRGMYPAPVAASSGNKTFIPPPVKVVGSMIEDGVCTAVNVKRVVA